MSAYLEKWSQVAKKEPDWDNVAPKKFDDYKKRVRRETLRGKTTFFHENIEDWISRQTNAHTVTRVGIHWVLSAALTLKSLDILANYFHGLQNFRSIKTHHSYYKLGPLWTTFYFVRPLVGIWITFRISKLLLYRFREQWAGRHDFFYTVATDEWTYTDWFRDFQDKKQVNFRYSDHVDANNKYGAFNPDIFKADADYAKGLVKHFRKGTDTYPEYFFKRSSETRV